MAVVSLKPPSVSPLVVSGCARTHSKVQIAHCCSNLFALPQLSKLHTACFNRLLKYFAQLPAIACSAAMPRQLASESTNASAAAALFHADMRRAGACRPCEPGILALLL